VKGLYRRNFWVVKRKLKKKNLYYVLTFVPDPKEDQGPNRFFILSQSEVNAEVPLHLSRIRRSRRKRGLPVEKVGIMEGLPWPFAERFEDKWRKLPS